jgi:hypothetical protein
MVARASGSKTLVETPRDVGNESNFRLSDCRTCALGMHEPYDPAQNALGWGCSAPPRGGDRGGGRRRAGSRTRSGGVGLVGGTASTPPAPGYRGNYGYWGYGYYPGYGYPAYPPSCGPPPPYGYAYPTSRCREVLRNCRRKDTRQGRIQKRRPKRSEGPLLETDNSH